MNIKVYGADWCSDCINAKKFLESNTLLNQEWIMEPKKKVKDILSEVAGKEKIEIERFVRYKVGEGV